MGYIQVGHIYRFVVSLGFLQTIAIRIALLAHVMVVDMFSFLKPSDLIFEFLDLIGGILKVLINNLGPFKSASEIIIGSDSGA